MVSVALLDTPEIGIESLGSGISRIAILSAFLEEVSGHCLLVKKNRRNQESCKCFHAPSGGLNRV